MMTVWSSMGCPRSPTPPRRQISGSSCAYGLARVYEFPTAFSVSVRSSHSRRRDPRGLRNQAPAIFLHERLSLSRLTSHIALFIVLSDSRYFLSHHQHVLGCKSRDSQRRRPLVDQLALCLTRVVPASELSGGRGHASENPLKTLAALSWQRNTPGLRSAWRSEHSRQSSACRGGESPSLRGHEGHLASADTGFSDSSCGNMHGADLTGANSAVSSCLSALLTHSGILSSSVPSLSSLGIYTSDDH